MAAEELRKETLNEGLELKERGKVENPAELLQESLAGLDKYGGFQLLKGLLNGAENMDPRRKAAKNIFLKEDSYKEARKELADEIGMWLSILEGGNTDVNAIKEICKDKRDNAEKNLNDNLLTIHDAVKKLEITYRTLDAFFANAGHGTNVCITLMNIDKSALSRHDSEDTKAIETELWKYYNNLSLTDNYSLLVMPGYLGRLDEKDTKDNPDTIRMWAKIANKNKVILITDFKDSPNFKMLMHDLESAKLQGQDAYLANTIMTCNYLLGRRKSEPAGEDEDLYIPGSGALAGLMSNTEELVIAQGAAGMKHGTLNNAKGVRSHLLKDEIAAIMDKGVIPMIEVDGRTMAFNNQSLYNGASIELQEYPIVRVFDWIGKVFQHFFNSIALTNWDTAIQNELKDAVNDFLNDYKGPGKLLESARLKKLDQNSKKDIEVEVEMKPFFAAKNFFIKLTGEKRKKGPGYDVKQEDITNGG